MAHQIIKGSLSVFDEDSDEWRELGGAHLLHDYQLHDYQLHDYQQQALDKRSLLYGAPPISTSGTFEIEMNKAESSRWQQLLDKWSARAPLPSLVYHDGRPGVALPSFFAWRLLLGTPNPVEGNP